MNDLRKFLAGIIDFSEEEMTFFVSLFSEKQLKKHEYFAKVGEFSSKFAFVFSGVLRAFYRNNEGNEYNKTFFSEANFVGAYSSLVSGQKNVINIQCLTNCTLLVADYGKMVELYDANHKIERLARIMAEQFFIQKEKREIELVMLDASERYRIFLAEHPNLENLIPQYYIASYLGITPTQLSRIRVKS